ncbi:MAG: hypothetical protein KAF27_05570, partial [Porphyrobacter sp.]|nr:hypothetical protein [Porphyrobacter sp.]
MTAPLGLEEAQARLLALVPQLPSETLHAEAAIGRFLAEDLRAARTQPPADLSAMDGYALAPGSGPWQLVGESRAGAPFRDVLAENQCIRISTGAIVAPGADRVLLQEDAVHEAGIVTAAEMPPPGRHIRARGFDFHEGDLLLARGARLTPAALALVLAGGHAQGVTPRQLRVAGVGSGGEPSAGPAALPPPPKPPPQTPDGRRQAGAPPPPRPPGPPPPPGTPPG